MIRLLVLVAVLVSVAACTVRRNPWTSAAPERPQPSMTALKDSFGGVATSPPSW